MKTSQVYGLKGLFQYSSKPGLYIHMTNTDPQTHVATMGESLTMECNFHADDYNLFECPIVWTKRQLTEEANINLMSNINHPFLQTNRFEVLLRTETPRYYFSLHIQSLYLLLCFACIACSYVLFSLSVWLFVCLFVCLEVLFHCCFSFKFLLKGEKNEKTFSSWWNRWLIELIMIMMSTTMAMTTTTMMEMMTLDAITW